MRTTRNGHPYQVFMEPQFSELFSCFPRVWMKEGDSYAVYPILRFAFAKWQISRPYRGVNKSKNSVDWIMNKGHNGMIYIRLAPKLINRYERGKRANGTTPNQA